MVSGARHVWRVDLQLLTGMRRTIHGGYLGRGRVKSNDPVGDHDVAANCQTDLVQWYRSMYPETFTYSAIAPRGRKAGR